MKGNAFKKIFLGTGIAFVVFSISLSIQGPGDIIKPPTAYVFDPNIPCQGSPYEPLLEKGLYATESCQDTYLGDYSIEIKRGAVYGEDGIAPIALISGEISKYDYRWGYPQPIDMVSDAGIGMPYKIVRRDGADIDPAHSPIPLGMKYAADYSFVGWDALNGSMTVYKNEDLNDARLASIRWEVSPGGSVWCGEWEYSNVFHPAPLEGAAYFDFDYDPSHSQKDSPYVRLSLYVYGFAKACAEETNWCDNWDVFIPEYSTFMAVEQAYLFIDPEWEHAGEYKIIALKDPEADPYDPASWVPHFDYPVDSIQEVNSWGTNNKGQLGDGTFDTCYLPTRVKAADGFENLKDVAAVDAQGNFNLALTSDRNVLGWGALIWDSFNIPFQVDGLNDIEKIACGGGFGLALDIDSLVWGFGWNNRGQLGDGTTESRPAPALVSGLSDVIAIDAGSVHSLALKSDGTVWAWGSNYYSQLGVGGSYSDRLTPVQVKGPGGVGFLEDIIAIAAGTYVSFALKSDGTVWAWGDNGNGNLGDGTFIERRFPVQVRDSSGSGYLTGIAKIEAGMEHTLALTTDGAVYAWGQNNQGQLGIGYWTADRHPLPMRVVGPSGVGYISGIVDIDCGIQHSLAVKSDGTLWAWGENSTGQIGDDAVAVAYSPIQVKDPNDDTGFLQGVYDVAAGSAHSLALSYNKAFVQVGTDVVVHPVDASTGTSPMTMTFDNVTDPGMTFLSSNTEGPPPETGFQLGTPPTFYYVMTTASYTGEIEICFDYSHVSYVDEGSIRLYHYEDGNWVDVTTSHDLDNDIICGTVTSLSPFAVFEFTADLDFLIQLVTNSEIDKGIKNSLVKKLENAQKSLSKGNTNAAINQIQAFQNEVKAQTEKKIPESLADEWLTLSELIIESLG